QITHVIRGEDHLTNTSRQINMFQALGAEPPVFAHVPMILGDDGARLSKRHGAVNVLDYRDNGYLPDALLNYLVRLGWSHGDQEVFSREEMIALFDIDDVNSAASAFNTEKLNWLNQHYLQAADAGAVAPLLTEQLERASLDPTAGPAPAAVFEAYRERAVTLAGLAGNVGYLYTDAVALEPKAAKKHLRPVIAKPLAALREALAALPAWDAVDLAETVARVADAHEIGMGKLGQPTRVAVTGSGASPGLDITLALVGRERTLARIDAALAFIAERENDS
ncbi:MAG: glutamate--tRNA ligase family protein, partial [Pseudomonadota bacterium]